MTNISRRQFLKKAGWAAGLLGSQRLAAFTAPASGKTQNLVFLISDQHSGLALACAGHPIVRTPCLDQLAREGVLFTHAYCAGTTCVPSRTSIHTGLHVHAHGARSNESPMRPDCLTISKILAEQGYELSYDLADFPEKRGHRREEFLQWLDKLGYVELDGPIVGSKAKAKVIPTPYRFAVGRAGLTVDHTLDAYTIGRAERFLEENRQRRFCLWVSLFCSHDPWLVPAPYDSMYRPADLPLPPYRDGEYDSRPRQQKRTWQATGADKLSDDQIRIILAHYFGMISQTDMLVGRLLDTMTRLGLNSNTTLIYTADHGDTMGYHRIFTKGFAFNEPAVRIPLIIRAPGILPAGSRVQAPVSQVDYLPTMLELIGLPPVRGVHGKSLVGSALGREKRVHERIFAGQGYEGLDRLMMMRTESWKYTRYDEGGEELYNLEGDPNELRSLAGDAKYAATARRLSRELDDWDRGYPHADPQPPTGNLPGSEERARRIREAFEAWKNKRA